MLEGFGILWLIFFVVCICISVAPLIIWRNTNRTNRLLALMLLRQGVPVDVVIKAYTASGSSIGGVPGSGVGFKEVAKKMVEGFKDASAPDRPTEPVPPKNRFCHFCGSDAPLDATACPNCMRELLPNPLHCPRCGHEITYRPTQCPGCGVKLKWKEPV